MREIKFRCWDGEKMLKPETLMTIVQTDDCMGFPDDGVFMQYTGLNDKNGKEIYEGDMLFNPAGGSIVSFHSGRFVVGDFGVDLYRFAGENKEVIGNIYETPELLTNN